MDVTDEVKKLVDSELSLAGNDTAAVAMKRRLEGLRITSETVVRQRRFLFSMFQIPCFPRGELVAVTGKKKCGKTYFCSVLMALCYKCEVMGMRRNEDDRMRVVWIDTEQSEESTKEILVERVGALARDASVSAAEAVANSVFAYNLRAYELEKRFMKLVGMTSFWQYGRLRCMAVENGIIVKHEVDPKCVFYTRGPKLDEGKPF